MESLNTILELLSDAQWHTLNEISTLEPLLHLPITDILQILNILAQYDFIEFCEIGIIQAKLTQSTQNFMKEIKSIEEELLKQNNKQ